MQANTSQIQQKRLQKELSMLTKLPKGFSVKQSPRTTGLSLIVELGRDKIESQKLLEPNINSLKFEVMIEHSFPFSAPRIFCRTSFCYPSLADGRDLLRDVLQKEWTPPMTIFEIIQILPSFISSVLDAQENNELKSRLYGTFHLGQDYDIKELMEYESCSVFQAKELTTTSKQLERYLVISHSAILFFEPYVKKRLQATLIQWATIQSLERIKRTLENPDEVQFHWRKVDEHDPGVLVLILENSQACLNAIVENMKNLGLKVDRNVATKRRLLESEVSQGAVTKKVGDIGALQESVARYQSLISEGALSVENVKTLMDLYNKAIEYYSALGDEKFAIYLQNMHIMLSREDIQVILSSSEEDVVKPDPEQQNNNNQGNSGSGPKHFLPEEPEQDLSKSNEEVKEVIAKDQNKKEKGDQIAKEEEPEAKEEEKLEEKLEEKNEEKGEEKVEASAQINLQVKAEAQIESEQKQQAENQQEPKEEQQPLIELQGEVNNQVESNKAEDEQKQG